MTYRGYFSEDFTSENAVALMIELDAVALNPEYTDVKLYFSSNGGEIAVQIMISAFTQCSCII